MRIFLAGASGVVGRRLVPLLVAAGHAVIGTTRSAEKAVEVSGQGATPVVVDCYDGLAVEDAVRDARPDVVVSQLTDLPQSYDARVFDQALKRNADIRRTGTANLVRAGLAAGTPRLVVQSVAFLYAPGPEPYPESGPLDEAAEGIRQVTVDGVVTMERLALETPGLRVRSCATAISTAPAPGTRSPRASRRSMSTPRHTPRYWPSTPNPGRTTSPTTPALSRSSAPAVFSGGSPPSGSNGGDSRHGS